MSGWILVMVLVLGPDKSEHMTHAFPTEQSCKAALISARAGLMKQLKEPAIVVAGCFEAPKKEAEL